MLCCAVLCCAVLCCAVSGVEHLSGKTNDWRNREHLVLDLFSNLKKGKDPRVSSGGPLKHVITLRGPFMVSRKFAIRDDLNIR